MKFKFLTLLTVAAAMTACDCSDKASTSDELGVGAGVGTSALAEAFAAETESKVYFGFDMYSLTPLSRQALETQAVWLKKHEEVSVEVQGYCDKRGPVAYNDRLGQRRADASKNHLIDLGVSGSRITTVSYGNRVTLVPGDTEEIYAKNRVAITKAL